MDPRHGLAELLPQPPRRRGTRPLYRHHGHSHAQLVRLRHLPDERGSGPPLLALRLHPHRRHPAQHGRQPRGGGHDPESQQGQDHRQDQPAHHHAGHPFHLSPRLLQLDERLCRAGLPGHAGALPGPDHPALQNLERPQSRLRLHHGRGDDPDRHGDPCGKPVVRRQAQILHHHNRQKLQQLHGELAHIAETRIGPPALPRRRHRHPAPRHLRDRVLHHGSRQLHAAELHDAILGRPRQRGHRRRRTRGTPQQISVFSPMEQHQALGHRGHLRRGL